MEKLSDEKKELIFTRLCQNCSVKEIAEELQISAMTVSRYKKSMKTLIDERKAVLEKSSVKLETKHMLTKKEQKYVDKIEKEIALYEDNEEGWVYHLSKSDLRFKQSGLWWSAIVYPESAPADWIDKLRAQGFRIAISPLHDKDVWSHDSSEFVDDDGVLHEKGEKYHAGDKKKAHFHVIIVVDTRTSYVEMNDILQKITNCPYIQKCRSLRNSYDYFLHINHPDRYQYEKSEIQTFNNFRVEPNQYEKNMIAQEMILLIKEHDILEWCDCVEFFNSEPEMALILSTRTAFFASYVKSRYYKINPHRTNYTEIKNVTKFSFEKEEEEKE